ncbi:ABC transporter ATP-binding protein [Paenibacillus gansuensis]|uniref:ABC transporter ATP-binding protein n=1 Tax=Paenibacillus gansuensis TaxID=306542 RepID=A0ABW5PGL2_9BACL
MSEYAVEIERVSKIYKLYNKPSDRIKDTFNVRKKKYFTEFKALDNVSFKIKKGETIGILGKNGAGKSTLLKMITGVLQPTAGDITVRGKISALLELGAGFNQELSGMENIFLNGTLMGFTTEEMEARLDSILGFADIGEFIHQPVKTYSSGMFARLAFSVAINVDPDILIVDEALSVGDVAFQTKCFKKFREFKEQGKTIIFVSHSLDSVLKFCTHAVIIHNGKKVEEGQPKAMVDIFKKILVNLYDLQDELKLNKTTEIKTFQGEWKTKFTLNKDVLEYGSKEAEIVDYGIFDSLENPTNRVISDETILIKMKVHFQKDVKEPIFAFTIKDLKGNELSGTNTMFQNIDTDLYLAGEEAEIVFTQKLNLQNGIYTLSLGCTAFDENNLVVYHRLYDVLSFEVMIYKNIVGIYDLNSDIEVKKQT